MEQTKLGSFYESLINIIIGWTINFTANMTIFPLFGWEISMEQNVLLGTIYTFISLVRSYVIRRWFNAKLHELLTLWHNVKLVRGNDFVRRDIGRMICKAAQQLRYT